MPQYAVQVNGKITLQTTDRAEADAEVERHLPARPGPAKHDIRLLIYREKQHG